VKIKETIIKRLERIRPELTRKPNNLNKSIRKKLRGEGPMRRNTTNKRGGGKKRRAGISQGEKHGLPSSSAFPQGRGLGSYHGPQVPRVGQVGQARPGGGGSEKPAVKNEDPSPRKLNC